MHLVITSYLLVIFGIINAFPTNDKSTEEDKSKRLLRSIVHPYPYGNQPNPIEPSDASFKYYNHDVSDSQIDAYVPQSWSFGNPIAAVFADDSQNTFPRQPNDAIHVSAFDNDLPAFNSENLPRLTPENVQDKYAELAAEAFRQGSLKLKREPIVVEKDDTSNDNVNEDSSDHLKPVDVDPIVLYIRPDESNVIVEEQQQSVRLSDIPENAHSAFFNSFPSNPNDENTFMAVQVSNLMGDTNENPIATEDHRYSEINFEDIYKSHAILKSIYTEVDHTFDELMKDSFLYKLNAVNQQPESDLVSSPNEGGKIDEEYAVDTNMTQKSYNALLTEFFKSF